MILTTIYSMRSLFVSMAFLFMGNAILVSSAAVLLNKMGASDLQIGIVVTGYYLGGMISTITSHKVVSHVGHIRSFAIFSSLLAFCGLMHIIFTNIWLWVVFRFILGYSYYSLLMIIESWLNTRAKNAIRSRILSVYEGVFYLAYGVGVLILGFGFDYVKTFAISLAFLTFCVIPISLIRVKEPSLPKKMKINFPNVFSTSYLAFFTAIVAGMLVNAYNSMSGVYMLKLGFSEKEFSYFLTLALFGGFVGQSFIGVFSDKFGRKIAIVSTSLIAFITSLIMIYTKNLFMLYILSFFIGMSVFCFYALALARANDQADKSQIVEVARTILFAYSLGSVISPMVIGKFMEYFGASGFMIFFAVSVGALLVFAMFRPIIPAYKRKSFEKQPGTMVNIQDDKF